MPTAGTITSELASSPYPTATVSNSHVFVWDIAANGVMGQSDNVVFRLVAIPSAAPLPHRIAGPFMHGQYATQTFPFRLRGTQVRVVDEHQQPVPQALVYRLPVSQREGSLITSGAGVPFRTSSQGYLQGRGQLAVGDQLLALAPVRSGHKYTLYYTSARPTVAGLDAYPVTQAGVQTLTVSAAYPLLLFDLDVSLEWNASNEQVFLEQLKLDLQKASAALYDWSNGQVALGHVTVYQERERWEEADVRIFASNQLRPSANRGGIVSDTLVLSDPRLSEPITATQGEVRIGPTWNRYGDAGPIGDDWPRVLAHEIAHYALFLEDTYLGLNAQVRLVGVESCRNTAMSDPYDDPVGPFSEFRYEEAAWYDEQVCGRTLAELPDWELIRLAYPDLHSPSPATANPGPSAMPFSFTTVAVQPAPSTAPPLLVDDTIALGAADSALAGSRAYLIRPGKQLVDLGQPTVSTVKARGARVGDTLCLFGPAKYACTPLSQSTLAQFSLRDLWSAELTLTPVNTTTLRLRVDDAGAGPLTAVIYPTAAHPQTVTLASGVEQTVALNRPTVEALVDIQGSGGQRMISSYAIGAGPGRAHSHDGPGRARSHDGPLSSSDGRIVLYPPRQMPKDVFLVVQTATQLPAPPPGRKAIGRAYQVRASGQGVDYAGASVVFQYVGMDVLLSEQPEANLAVYFWDGSSWQRLVTELDERHNFASAPLLGPGLYALMSGFQVPLPVAGWNLVAYPLDTPLPVGEALESITGHYSTVYGYTPETGDLWQVYAPTAPLWVNDLQEMTPGHGYWIHATAPVTWFVTAPAVTAAQQAALPAPPATFYGEVRAGDGFSPGEGMPVVAYVAGARCGQSETRLVDGRVVYVVDVLADGESALGCGAPGRRVTFETGGQMMGTTALWDNREVRSLALAREADEGTLYLPALPREEADLAPADAERRFVPLLAR
jgi:hypothetical protein